MANRHRVFISYHDGRSQGLGIGDLWYRKRFEQIFDDQADVLISRAVQDGDINPYLKTDTIRQRIRDEYLRDSSVTVVLVGARTWQRKHVDWEIGASIRYTDYNPRSGLLGILLPTYPGYAENKYNPNTLPPRLYDNVKNGYATLHLWTEDPRKIEKWVHDAFIRRKEIIPDNSYPPFVNNRSGERWF